MHIHISAENSKFHTYTLIQLKTGEKLSMELYKDPVCLIAWIFRAIIVAGRSNLWRQAWRRASAKRGPETCDRARVRHLEQYSTLRYFVRGKINNTSKHFTFFICPVLIVQLQLSFSLQDSVSHVLDNYLFHPYTGYTRSKVNTNSRLHTLLIKH